MTPYRLPASACWGTALAFLSVACTPAPPAPPSGPLVLAAAQLEPRPMRYYRDHARAMLRESGYLEASVYVPRVTRVALTVTAAGESLDHVKPAMAVHFDRAHLGEVRVEREPTAYRFQTTAEPGTSLLQIYFLNPLRAPDGAGERSLTVYTVTVEFPAS